MKPSDLIPTQDIDALVKLAHVARREGDRAAALAAFEAAAAANPTRVGLKAEVATELRTLGRLDEAEALLRQALAIDPLHVGSLAELGHIARRRGDRAAALAAFEAAAAANPTHVGLKADVASELRELGRLDEAEVQLRQALALQPQHAASLVQLGHIARRRGDRAAALVAFQAAATADPAHVGLKAEVASELRELGRLDEAETLLRQALLLQPQHAALLAQLGHIARRRGDHVAALRAFEAAAAANPTHIGLRVDVASELREQGRLDEAEAQLRNALALQPQHAASLAQLGHIARQRGDRAAALAAFEAATTADPSQVGLKAEVASELREQGRLDEAEALLRQVLALQPQNAASLAQLGHIARRRGDHIAALAAFEAAIAANPTHVGLEAAAAAELRELGRLEEAEALLRHALALDPQHLPSLVGVGHVARRRGDRAAALAAFQSAAATNVSDIGQALEIANSLRDLGEIAAAELSFQRILGGNPDNPTALIGLGSIRFEQFRLDEAEELFRRAGAAAPDQPAALISLGRLARRRGDHEQALARFSAARDANPSHAGAAFETAAALRELGRVAEARDVLDGVLQSNPRDHAAIMQLGYLHRQEGERRMALEKFTLAHEQREQQPQPLIEMAVELRALGNPRLSEALLRRALAVYPDYQAALEQLAEHHLLAEDFAEALRVARRAIAIYPHRQNPYLVASRAAAELGNREEVIKLLDQADELAGPYPEIRAVRANFYMQLRDWDAAYKLLLDPAAQTPRHSCLWTLLAKLAITTGDYELAEATLPAAPATVHDASRAYVFRGQIAEARWDLDRAAENYRQAVSLTSNDGGAHFELSRVSLKLLDLEACRFHLGRQIGITASSLRLRGQSLNVSQTHVGQILDEFALDGTQLDALRHARLLPPELQISPLREIVMQNPDYTPAAMMLLIALRQAGKLVRAPERPPNGVFEHIPRCIVQYWNDAEPPPEISDLMESWKKAHPDFEYVRLDDESAQKFLDAHGMHDAISAYRRAREPAQQADLIRLAYLAVKGGVYADADDRCIGPVGAFVPPDATFVAYQEDYGTLGNNFLAVVPDHPVIRLALQLAAEALNRGDHDFLWLSTGPGVLSRAFAQLISRPQSSKCERFEPTIFDLGFIARRIGFHCPVVYKKTIRHWSRSNFGRRKRVDLKRSNRAIATLESQLLS